MSGPFNHDDRAHSQCAPIVLFGMHRSGTSAFSEALQQLGLFLGSRLDSHHESTFFQRINRRLEAEAGGHWSNPDAIKEGIAALDDKPEVGNLLWRAFAGVGGVEYRGARRSVTWCETNPFGWKDPRNGLTLDLWLHAFPQAKAIMIRRHPGAAAFSLFRRSHALRDEGRRLLSDRTGMKISRRLLRGQWLVTDSYRTLDLARAFEISLRYNEIYAEIARQRPCPILVVDYDIMLDSPLELLRESTEFAGLSPTEDQFDAVVNLFHNDSRDLFLTIDGMEELIHTNRARLEAIGY